MVNVVPAQDTELLFAKVRVWALPPSAMVELAAKFKVDELVNVLVPVILVVLKVPPFNTICEAKVAFALGFNLSSPAVMVVEPVYEFAVPVKVKIPAPVLIKLPAPLLSAIMPP